jgi:hypothetical protein
LIIPFFEAVSAEFHGAGWGAGSRRRCKRVDRLIFLLAKAKSKNAAEPFYRYLRKRTKLHMEIHSYGIAQICKNGHVLTDRSNATDLKQKFCSDCGELIINQCEACQQYIQGRPRAVSVIDPPFMYFGGPDAKPSFCIHCGTPFPWTTRVKEAIDELIQFSESLTPVEKEDFKTTVTALTVDSPRSQVALVKFKSYISKVGTEAAKIIKDMVKDIATEAIKKAIFKG